ncbi:hypothetical protein ETAA8_41960 [Anatilimnocola aggregata]|uniref:Uncharacterized protein n=1 Tax=Anatilimnocola aggregata TaxID=2528021 RepID=A0A517YFU1_9BACT|nr:hypothetical protein ETAA8_41960 [Anatilimnocola aggregata]
MAEVDFWTTKQYMRLEPLTQRYSRLAQIAGFVGVQSCLKCTGRTSSAGTFGMWSCLPRCGKDGVR